MYTYIHIHTYTHTYILLSSETQESLRRQCQKRKDCSVFLHGVMELEAKEGRCKRRATPLALVKPVRPPRVPFPVVARQQLLRPASKDT